MTLFFRMSYVQGMGSAGQVHQHQARRQSSITGLRGILKNPISLFDTIIPGLDVKHKVTITKQESPSLRLPRWRTIEASSGSSSPTKTWGRYFCQGASSGPDKENWDSEILEEIDQYVAGWIKRRGILRLGHSVPMTENEKKSLKRMQLSAMRERVRCIVRRGQRFEVRRTSRGKSRGK